ncbi:MAG: shikimate kinase [Rikenellaceae bacterium]
MLIFLIGYMACGKSTIGRKLIKRHPEWRLVDSDNLIEQQSGLSVSEIFAQHGEKHFRELERATLNMLIEQGGKCIVSTGGGLPTWSDNMDRMNSSGATIYIRRTAENIASRLSLAGREKRPKLRGLSDEELVEFMAKGIEERDTIYSRSQLIIEATTLSDRDILDMIDNFVTQ